MANLQNNNAQLAALLQILMSAQGNKGYGSGYGKGAMQLLPNINAEMQFNLSEFMKKMNGNDGTPDPNAPIVPNQPVDINDMTKKQQSFFDALFNRDVWKGSKVRVGN